MLDIPFKKKANENNRNKNRFISCGDKFKEYSNSKERIEKRRYAILTKNSTDKIAIKYVIFYIKYLLIHSLLFSSFLKNDYGLFKINASKIRLKIKGKGYAKIYNKFYVTPQGYINGYLKSYTEGSEYNFDQVDNNIELIINGNLQHAVLMFTGCSSITEMDLSEFDISQVIDMDCMFQGCTSLTSLRMSNYISSRLTDLRSLFEGCSKLTFIDLSNFRTAGVAEMQRMFYGCTNLKFINLINFSTNSLSIHDDMFNNLPSNFYVCIPNGNRLITDQIKTNNYRSQTTQVNYICIEFCDDEIELIYNGTYYEICKNDYLIRNSKNNTYNCEIKNFCLKPESNEDLCSRCGIDYFSKENDYQNNDYNINCFKEFKGYYLDTNDFLFKKCYYSCESCLEKGNYTNHYCSKCNSNYPFYININNSINCYENCTYYYYFDNEKYYNCTDNYFCPDKYNKLIPNKRQCINECLNDEKYIYELKNICYEECPYPYLAKNSDTHCICDEDKMFEIILHECANNCSINDLTNKLCIFDKIPDENEKEIYIDIVLKHIEKGFMSFDSNISNSKNESDTVIIIENIKITLTTSENQNNIINEDNNNSILYLGECETKLRGRYNLSNDEKLYIKKIDIFQNKMKIPKIEYDIYGRLNGSNLEKLDKSICERLYIFTPVIITENIDELYSNSRYYNDLCYGTTSENGTDITLNDRKDNFIKNNRTICQEDCDFKGYNTNIRKAKCWCKVEETPLSIKDMKINITKLYTNFLKVENFANFNLLFCYNSLFSKYGIIINIGFFITAAILILHIICMFICCFTCEKKINKILKDSNSVNEKKIEKKNNINLENEKKINIIKNKKNTKLKYNTDNNNLKSKKKIRLNLKKDKKNKDSNKKEYNIINERINPIKNIIRKNKEIKNKGKRKNKNTSLNSLLNSKKEFKNKKIKNTMKFNDDEKNLFTFDKAVIYDKRTYCQYYLSLLKTKHSIIFTFFYNGDYNLKIMKIDIFFISFTINYTVNAMFFNDDTIHEIYVSGGDFCFEYQILKMIYSSLISIVFNTILKLLALSSDNIIIFKQDKKKTKKNEGKTKLIQKLKVKFVLYFIISFIFLLFFMFYLSIFCIVYRNSQYHLIEDTLISFGLSLFYPFGIYLLPGIFRMIALSKPKKKREILFKFSKILQIL